MKKGKKKNSKDDAFKEIESEVEIFRDLSYEELTKKFSTLCQSYRVYRRKINASKRSGSGAGDVYQPCWTYFNAMDAFMRDTYAPQGAHDAVSIE